MCSDKIDLFGAGEWFSKGWMPSESSLSEEGKRQLYEWKQKHMPTGSASDYAKDMATSFHKVFGSGVNTDGLFHMTWNRNMCSTLQSWYYFAMQSQLAINQVCKLL